MLNEAAKQAGVEAIVTRNSKDFAHSKLVIYTPLDLAVMLRQTPEEEQEEHSGP